ncbi:hypothetical protein CLUG_00452 [Clavispora lusitaniae ATCC 42720]|uniref:Uncharacterized protein n=1 Tax=Clavispora lusitaniae (strain ATCC 42720) TaxID=306902 RepID=C4XWX9_CLAL4|nr:uncharacterized protein CLUG_00452 [Clavispora lusitaniae ATCC 42720]EEQ36328.1 hypothetical protein CLUG_00452 [Clavispora lusitaniae ATCC 42720]
MCCSFRVSSSERVRILEVSAGNSAESGLAGLLSASSNTWVFARTTASQPCTAAMKVTKSWARPKVEARSQSSTQGGAPAEWAQRSRRGSFCASTLATAASSTESSSADARKSGVRWYGPNTGGPAGADGASGAGKSAASGANVGSGKTAPSWT